jgi:MerR family transcriptional regulator, copper efflux regulator
MPSGGDDRLVAEPVGETMTIGELSERTGVPVKQLRRYEDLGFIYTVGRTATNYRLFDQTALWCVDLVKTWRSLGLTLTEISELTEAYLDDRTANVGPRLAERLGAVRDRTESRIEELRELVERIDAFEAEYGAELSGEADFRRTDPRFRSDA